MNRGSVRRPVQTKIKLMQINVDRKQVTQDVVFRRAYRDRTDILIINESNKKSLKRNEWYTDNRMDAALVVINGEMPVHGKGRGDGFVWLELEEFVVYSCYCSPNIDKQSFEKYITDLGEDVRKHSKDIVIDGDFNAKSAEWGSHTEDARGTIMMQWVSGSDLIVLNQGGCPTFVRYEQKSHIDVTLCTGGVAPRITNWKVLKEETIGWHRIIRFEYRKSQRETNRSINGGWMINKERLVRFRENLDRKVAADGGRWNTPCH